MLKHIPKKQIDADAEICYDMLSDKTYKPWCKVTWMWKEKTGFPGEINLHLVGFPDRSVSLQLS